MNEFLYSTLKKRLTRLELDYADPTISAKDKENVRNKLNELYRYFAMFDKQIT